MNALCRAAALIGTAAVGAGLAALMGASLGCDCSGTRFEIGLIGDTRYTDEQKAKFPNLVEDINRYHLAFVVHDGDIKGGRGRCTDENLTETRDLFNRSAHPLIYTPGDNEWTDCHLANGDPSERLAAIREVFFSVNESLGQRRMGYDRQSQEYPENARWSHGGVTFATLHVVGSNNNFGRTPDADAEYIGRNRANLDWIAMTFDEAQARGSAGVMFIMQANPWGGRSDGSSGFGDTLRTLEERTLAFQKPVVLVHGDSHYFRIDKPLMGTSSNRRIENFTRVETFGTDDVHWVRATIDPSDPGVFGFREQIVAANLVEHGG